MKLIAFGVREDEEDYMEPIAKSFGFEIKICHEHLSLNTVNLAKGYDAVSIVGVDKANRDVLNCLSKYGIKALSTRTIGYNHIDLQAAKEFGIDVSNVAYSPHSVADFTVMLMLVLIRRFAHMLERSRCMDYSLEGIQGKEMHNLTIGIIGMGRIGTCVAQNLQGFGCKVLAYARHPKEEQKNLVEFVDLDTLVQNCDVISLHLPLTENTRYMIDEKMIRKMKRGVILINTSRGELIDTNALIDGIESGVVGGAGIDSIEGEENIIHIDHNYQVIKNRDLLTLKAYPNVVVTPHAAFFTDQVSYDMVHCSFEGLYDFLSGKPCPWKLN